MWRHCSRAGQVTVDEMVVNNNECACQLSSNTTQLNDLPILHGTVSIN